MVIFCVISSKKVFTERLYSISGGKFFYYLNCGFYAILENDIRKVYENYSEIYKRANSVSFDAVDVVDFLEQQRSIVGSLGSEKLIDFAQAFHTRMFIDDKMGETMVDEFIVKNRDNDNLSLLCDLCKKTKQTTTKVKKSYNKVKNKRYKKKGRNKYK